MKAGGSDDTFPAGDAVGRTDPRLGSVIDKYTVVRLLGRGGMGAVYEARHTVLARRAALKFLLPQFAEHPELLRRFENEAKAAGQLEHPNIAAVMDFGRGADNAPYLVMEFLDGEDCARLLERVGRLPIARAVDIVRQACRGLAVAHRTGIVHRDLKPENLFITRSGDGNDWVKVLDFGIAKLRQLDGAVPTRTGATLGTAYYMSPEQARGAVDVDERTDVWSLGVVLYELLSGRRPFGGEQFLHIVHRILSVEPPPLGSLEPDLPSALLDVVARAMTKDADLRIASVDALAEALAPFSSQIPVHAEVANPVQGRSSRTELTPATSIDGVAIGDTGIRPRNADTPEVKAAGSKRVPMLIAAAVLGSAGLAGYLTLGRTSPRPETSASARASALPSAPAAVLPVQKPSAPESLASVAVPPPSASASVSARAATPAPDAPSVVRPGRTVRSVSEHEPPSSNRTEPLPPPSPPAAILGTAPVVKPAPAPSVPPDLGEKRTIDIEKGNPYE